MTDTPNPVLAEVWRGDYLECVHRGTAVVATASGEIVEAWGDPDRVILPRSACKMLQALPLVESGAADDAGLGIRHLALSCASHQGAFIHADLAESWLAGLGMAEPDLRCGPQVPNDRATRHALAAEGRKPSQLHNNCSGKHCGMLTLGKHLGAGPEYIDLGHPVQTAIRQAISEVSGEQIDGFAIDGCSAPNFAMTIGGFARALARFATPEAALGSVRGRAAERLRDAMMAHPELVAGEGRSCTALMRATKLAAVKTGAEGVFAAILPEKGLGIALKIDDGATRASEAALTALLVRHGALDPDAPVVGQYGRVAQLNRRGIDTGRLQAADALW